MWLRRSTLILLMYCSRLYCDRNASNSATNSTIAPSLYATPYYNETSNDEEIPHIRTVEELCKLPQILEQYPNCSCEVPDIKKSVFCQDINTELIYPKKYSQATAAVSTVILLFAGFGNTVVIILLIKQWKELTHLKKLVLALAVCDLTFAVAQFVQYFRLFWTNSYIYGRIPCKLLQCSITTGSFVAMSIILIIVMERFVGIVLPFGIAGYKVPDRIWSIWLFLNVLIAFGTSIPVAVALDIEHFLYGKKMCTLYMSEKQQLAFQWFVVIYYSVLPTLIMVVAYIFIFRALYRSVSKKKLVMVSDPLQKAQRLRDAKRAVLVFLVVIISFIVLVFPYRIFALYRMYNKKLRQSEEDSLALDAFLPLLAQFHVAVNPIIYSIMDPKMRYEALKLLRIPFVNLPRTRTVSTDLPSLANGDAPHETDRILETAFA